MSEVIIEKVKQVAVPTKHDVAHGPIGEIAHNTTDANEAIYANDANDASDAKEDALDQYQALYTQHQRRLFLYINAMLPCAADADEVFQETNIIIWKKFDQFQPGTDFLAWAYRIAYFQIRDYRRRLYRRRTSFSPELIEQLAERTIEEDDLLEERRSALANCRQNLTEDDRELLNDCYAPGAKVQQIAAASNRKPTSIYRSLRRIRQLLFDCITAKTESTTP
jgi:RNA polymerase sigma-70 factor, ECF subfamily